MTKLENAVFSNPKYSALGSEASRSERQKVLDEITEEVLAQLSTQDILQHVHEIYDATVNEYASNPHTKHIIDELVEFMEMLPNGAPVLDLGCGTGRDTLFMSVKDRKFRELLMKNTTLDKFPVPTKTFRVTAIDNALEMLALARDRESAVRREGFMSGTYYPLFDFEDMHNIDPQHFGPFDGIWSCTALFTHTPKILLKPAMKSLVTVIKPDAVLFLSYTSDRVDGRYNKLLPSRTGRIKYFSQPDPNEITKIAKQHDLALVSESLSDYNDGKVIKKDLFVSQFFKKV